LLSSNISPTCPYNMMNFGPLAAEIVSLVWGTPANFNGFRFLAALLHSQTAALNRGRHLYSAGRPSRWALAHISSFPYFVAQTRLPAHLSSVTLSVFSTASLSVVGDVMAAHSTFASTSRFNELAETHFRLCNSYNIVYSYSI